MHMGAHEKILPMTPEEIKREYLEAKDGAHQIRILADENLCSVSKIKTVLEAQGVELPKKRAYTKKPPREPFTLDAPTPDEQLTMTFADYELELLVDLLGIAQEAAQEAVNKTEAELKAAKGNLEIIKAMQERLIAIQGKGKNE